ncbi:MAG: glycosyltransferase family 2 protein [Gemmatimonadaceae bacterium]|nr:glycosyltransferase family 2 protein [Gemmatimonadaceae bacterium]
MVIEPRPGLAWARNRALLEARSDVMLFTDDDCVPDAGWIEAHRSLYDRNPDIDLSTGPVEPLELVTPAQVLFERYGGFIARYRRQWICAPRGIVSAPRSEMSGRSESRELRDAAAVDCAGGPVRRGAWRRDERQRRRGTGILFPRAQTRRITGT